MREGVAAARRGRRREHLRAALLRDPLLTDLALGRLLGVSVQTVRLDRLALGIPEVRHRAREVAQRSLHGGATPTLRGEVVDLEPGVSAVALLSPGPAGAVPWAEDPALFADAEALAVATSGLVAADVRVASLKFRRAACADGRLVAKAEVLRRGARVSGERRVVLVQIRCGDEAVFRAKFVVDSSDEGVGEGVAQGAATHPS